MQFCAKVWVFMHVCLCGMAGQRNALAHAWLSRHNGPALSHCREIPLRYRGREKENKGDAKSLKLSENCCRFFTKSIASVFFFVWNSYLPFVSFSYQKLVLHLPSKGQTHTNPSLNNLDKHTHKSHYNLRNSSLTY